MKKTLKLLILLMSLALIVGALSVVAFAKDGEDDAVIVTGDIDTEGTFDDALAEIIENGDGEYTITLQGNCESEGAVLDDSVNEAREVTIDLNGYTLDLEDATTAFNVAAFNTLNVTGSGEILIGSQLVSTTTDCDSVINFIGTGAGIKITSTTEAVNKIVANGTSEINFKNVNFSIDYDVLQDGSFNPSDSVITVNDGTKVTFENSQFVYTVDFFADEGFREVLDGNTGKDAWRNQQYYGLRNCYFATMNGASQLVLNNTYVKTPTSGVKFVGATGMDNAIAEGKYALVMNGSTLFCVNDSDATAEYNKFIGLKGANLRLLLFEFGDGEISTADLYIKNSYTAATYRPINSRSDMAAQSDPVHAIYDGSTFELYQYTDVKAGFAANANGEGVFDNGPIYMTFKNNSAINLSGANLRPGGTSNNNLGDKLVKGTSVGSGVYCIDIEAGTKTSGSFSNCDIPENAAFKGNPAVGYMKVPFIVMDKDADTGYAYTGRGALSIQNDNGTVTIANIGSLDGYSNVKQIKTMSLAEIKAHAKYDPATRTLDTGKGSYVVSEDGNSFKLNAIAGNYIQYDNCYDTDKITNDDAVVVMAFHVKPDENNPLRFWGTASNTYFWPHTRPKTGGHYWGTNNMVSTDTVTSRTPAGEWSEIAFVIDYTTGIIHTLINGETVVTKGFGADVIDKKVYFDAMWLTYGSGTFTDTASMYIDGVQVYGFEDKYTGTFDPAEYLNVVRSANADYMTPDVANGAFTVGNRVFDKINDALVYANSIGSFVTLNAPVENAYVTEIGFVRTNGYDFTYVTTLASENGNNTVAFVEADVDLYDFNWYIGTAENPAEDDTNMVTLTLPAGYNLFVPEGVKVADIENDGGVYKLSGWSTTYLRPTDYNSAAEYRAAIAEIDVISDFSTVVTGTQGATYYPVYGDITVIAFKVIKGDGTVINCDETVDFTEAFCWARNNGKLVLTSNVVVTKTINSFAMGDSDNPSGDMYQRTNRTLDLNGYNLHFAIPGNDYIWMQSASGSVTLTSSRPGATITQADKSGGGCIFQARGYCTFTVNDPNNYITVIASAFASADQWNGSQTRAGKVVINGGTYIFSSALQGRGFLYADMYDGTQAFDIKNATFINAGSCQLIFTRNGHVQTYTNCTFINLSGKGLIVQQEHMAGKGVPTVNFNNCSFSNFNLSGIKNCNVTGNTVASYIGNDIKLEGGKVAAYTNAQMSMPAALGESYTVLNQNGEAIKTITAADLSANYSVVDAANATLYTWAGYGDTTYTAYVAGNANAADLTATAAKAVTTTKNLTALKLAVKTWKLEGTTFTPDELEATGLAGFGAFANVKLEEGFVLGILVTPANYEFLSAESKALFTKVTLEGVDYYIASADRAVNAAFTAFTVEVKVEEEGYDYTTSYTVSVMDYLELVAAAEVREEMDKIVAYIGAYLNNAYAYFTTTDATEADLAALAAFVAANAPEAITAPEAPEAIDTNGNLEIKLDLTATPAFVITSKVAGTVTFNGETTNLVANEPLRLEASVLDFDNALTFALEGDVTGNYCLANYAATIAAATEIEGLNEEQLTALKALVASFYDYVIYAENFR